MILRAQRPEEHLTSVEVDNLSRKLLQVDTKLNFNIPATLWISDIHGEGERFKSILRGRFGMLYQTCVEALPKTFSTEKIQYLVSLIRKQHYEETEAVNMDMQDVIMCFVEILKYKLSNVEIKSKDVVLPEYREVIERMISGLPVPDPVFEEPIISCRIISHLAYAIKRVLLNRIMVLGDVFDRGSQPDKVLRFLSSYSYRNIVHYVLGNHDLLWMGAAIGNESLIAEAMRITCRYDHFVLLGRLGINTDKLEAFAKKHYPPEKISGNFKSKTDLGRSMEKALAIIQFKLEEKTIRFHPEYEMDSRLLLDDLAERIKSGNTEDLTDVHFPTLDLEHPNALTDEEQEIIDNLQYQFIHSRKLKRLIQFLFEKGQTYQIHNNMLNIHALIPSTEDGEFDEFRDRKGKALLDYIQKRINTAGEAYIAGEEPLEADTALFFYLWSGPKSPFFGKNAMKTFERYFYKDKETHREQTLYWSKNLQSKDFKDKIINEFGIKRVIFGHVPVDVTKGKKMASDDGLTINIDGGFAKAYYNRGHALVQTPFQLYGIILPTPEEIQKASESMETVPLSVEIIDTFNTPIKIRHTYAGKKLIAERAEILRKLKNVSYNY